MRLLAVYDAISYKKAYIIRSKSDILTIKHKWHRFYSIKNDHKLNRMSFFKKIFSKEKKETLDKGLEKTKTSFFTKLSKAVAGKSKVDDDVLDNLEEILVASDVGVATTLKIIDRIEARVARDKYLGTSELNKILREEIAGLLSETNLGNDTEFTIPKNKKPYVLMVVGVNGVGKTTTIGKLAAQFKKQGLKVVLGAADTFRAAAIDQLQVWADRTEVPIVRQEMGSDPASVAFDTLKSAVSQDADVVIIDTAGRLHNKVNLMNELTKIKRVMQKVVADAPHDVLLVLDGSTGQNAFEQAKQFTKATEVTSLAVTKLDGTAKGGVVIGISDQFQIPVKYIGVGEGIDDLQVFNKNEFVDSFFI
ncbi:Signal recognition particle receptor FtsY [Tenacibaculum maritimum]|uniref:Signal recognition particle receptor FtsY n=2 Tax=Tenacibaculum maritimum TaxID=107401 RepID=A0A2H1EBA6_9FLAO|nr:Signal recognition particle receptor FtsY [Tenacibaculum maritimum]SFZ83870.1 Signal recognition particle receptor FtsY [Tenacibaculum maritimum NCIMB 2154]CAA0144657.1 Signal recognition particle receptor FtsY [Tenacibaculum maritimum]CAA0144929.1 Signal recognition particle receptor FtsY [Tenacibaculum maritimum]CAA0155412.1 Signal recognition particle receptor FtsY [Tenacibaculum maritimum]